jgi:hypothetical protein
MMGMGGGVRSRRIIAIGDDEFPAVIEIMSNPWQQLKLEVWCMNECRNETHGCLIEVTIT